MTPGTRRSVRDPVVQYAMGARLARKRRRQQREAVLAALGDGQRRTVRELAEATGLRWGDAAVAVDALRVMGLAVMTEDEYLVELASLDKIKGIERELAQPAGPVRV